MRKQINLIAVNARYTHSNAAVRYLKKYCACDEYDLHISEYSINSDKELISEKILSGNYFAVGFSVYIWNVLFVKQIIRLLKDKGYEGKIFLGGPETSYNADELLSQEPGIDFIIKGFGEGGLKYLLQSDFTHKEKIISMPNLPFNEIPFLYEGDDFSTLKHRYIYYETSRGCPYRCAYCLSSADGHDLDLRDIEKVKSELNYIMAYKPMIVKFIDRTFNFDKKRSREIWKFLIKNSDGKIKFHFEINPALLDDEDFLVLAEAPKGIFRFEAGIQSINKSALEAVNRPGDWIIIKKNLQKIVSCGNIHLHVDLIAGLPREDINSFAHGFNELHSIGAAHIQLGFLKILPGTELRARGDEYGMRYDNNPPYEIRYNESMSRNDILLLKTVESMLDNYYNSGKFILTLNSLLENFISPFLMYKNIAEYYTKNSIVISGQNSLEKILLYIEENHAEQAAYLRDCLRWDYLINSKNLRLPVLLHRADEIMIKKSFWKKIDGNFFEKHEIESIKKGYIFFSESAHFQIQILKGNDLALFSRSGTSPIFYSLK